MALWLLLWACGESEHCTASAATTTTTVGRLAQVAAAAAAAATKSAPKLVPSKGPREPQVVGASELQFARKILSRLSLLSGTVATGANVREQERGAAIRLDLAVRSTGQSCATRGRPSGPGPTVVAVAGLASHGTRPLVVGSALAHFFSSPPARMQVQRARADDY